MTDNLGDVRSIRIEERDADGREVEPIGGRRGLRELVTARPGDTLQSMAARMAYTDHKLERFLTLNDRDGFIVNNQQQKLLGYVDASAAELRRIERDSEEFVVPFIQDSIEPGAIVRTDGSAAYRSLASLGYEHRRNVILGSKVPAHISMAGVHRVASLIKRWVLGTHHGSVQPEHLEAYLEEFVFRFNRRTSRSRGMLFYRLLQQAVATDPVTYNDIISLGGKAR